MINILGKLRKIIINIELSWITPPKTRLLTIIGEKQSLYIDCISQKIIAFKGEKKTNLGIKQNNTLQSELKYFLETIKEGTKENIINAKIGRDNLVLLNKVKLSLSNQSIIHFNK